MINFDEEIKNFKPSLEISKVEDAIVRSDITDVQDVMLEMLKNASKEYDLTDREKDIIKKHMWPLTVVPPLCREAWLVTAADKYVSTIETLAMRKKN